MKSRTLYELAASRGSASACHNLALNLQNNCKRDARLYLRRAQDLSAQEALQMSRVMKF